MKFAGLSAAADLSLDVLNLNSGERRRLIDSARGIQYLDSNHILYGSLIGATPQMMVVPFDIQNAKLAGVPVTLPVSGEEFLGLTVLSDGTLLLRPGGAGADRSVVIEGSGNQPRKLDVALGELGELKPSPDGKFLAYQYQERTGPGEFAVLDIDSGFSSTIPGVHD